AEARTCHVRLTIGEALCVEIADDGRGLPTGHQPGVGLASMRERAAELGGTCAIEPGLAGGTHVIASLPLGESSVAGRQSSEGLPGAPRPPVEPTITSGHRPLTIDDRRPTTDD
ncbi:MAG: hypothetical protein M3Q65_08300, partial [Chloroflexota bacterium]|nr:hypothetical protein [Chloroflexota bacterium]